jgi:hypothetical protein
MVGGRVFQQPQALSLIELLEPARAQQGAEGEFFNTHEIFHHYGCDSWQWSVPGTHGILNSGHTDDTNGCPPWAPKDGGLLLNIDIHIH